VPHYFDFEIKPVGVKARVARRFALSMNSNFCHLHQAIQDVYGLACEHPYIFYDTKKMHHLASGPDVRVLHNEVRTELDHLPLSFYFNDSSPGKHCTYVYGTEQFCRYGVKLWSIFVSHHKFVRRLLNGANVFPIEDGGVAEPFDLEKAKKAFDWDEE